MIKAQSLPQKSSGTSVGPSGPDLNIDVIVLPALVESVFPSLPVVRIYLGSETSQYRAERVFVWSVRKHRDPARRYEIHILRDLAGFDRTGWTTGFTNYRFAIPELAGGAGRAIYNDVDQVYLADPAGLFDAEMNGTCCLVLEKNDTSVMLIDCAALLLLWNLQLARSLSKKVLISRVVETAGMLGTLPPIWNARDEEYEHGYSKLLHYTTLHLQPWMPDPARFAYRTHPHGEMWFDLEREADQAGFTLFDRDHPSRRYLELLECYRSLHRDGETAVQRPPEETFQGKVLPRHQSAVGHLIEQSGATTILDYGAGKASAYHSLAGAHSSCAVKWMPAWGESVRVTLFDPGYVPYATLPEGHFDGVISTDVLEHLAEHDVPWVLQEIFNRARGFVYASIANYPARKVLPNGENAHTCQKPMVWWEHQFRSAARSHPGVHWEFVLREKDRIGRKLSRRRSGGRRLNPPTVWILDDGRPGNTHQAIALAQALGYSYELKSLAFGPLSVLHNRLLGASRLGLQSRSAACVAGASPDLVLAAGRRTAPVARWIGAQSGGATRLVQLGRKGGDVADNFDAVVTPIYCRMASHPARIETMLPLSPLAVHTEHRQPRTDQFDIGTLVLVGGATKRHLLDEDVAGNFIRRLRKFQKTTGEPMMVATSRRTSADVIDRFRRELGDVARVCTPAELGLRYMTSLQAANRVVVTNDSESMIADAVSSGHPVFIQALPLKPPTWWHRLGSSIEGWSQRRPRNSRTTVRPQRGLEYLGARLIEKGYVRPPRDLEYLQSRLFQSGAATPFDDLCCAKRPSVSASRCASAELKDVARRVRQLLATDD